ncbi:membrane protein [Youhaiella tibetensis]|uniref:DUF2852 domain-containing protein n=1 Tax=Paradevosia tibetensis TaxID=1447062 RepID=A0A5B9DI04_9HYPH|nr:DUF2852 domain-containing protein [Youhaiella tibetensis]QEE18666.1 DUF2852 domain-containing protein [Youhaiella tibetensis]GGF40306.1 membrane protein [Youhaiella tibetensis]
MHTAIIKPQWSPLTIALMVLGFIVFWPLGLAMLAYIIWGEKFGGSAERADAWVNKQKAWANRSWGCGPRGFARNSFGSGNAAFDEYRDEQLKRLEEERRRLDEEINEFHEYMRNLRMAKDREEFDRFMRNRNGNRPNYGQPSSDDNPTQV